MRADQVIFNNGDRLSGTVVSIAGGKIILNSELLGEMTIELAQVKSIETEAPLPVVLKQHPQTIEALLKPAPSGIALEYTGQSRLIKLDDILALGKAVSAGQTQGDGEKSAFKWSGKIDAGLKGRSGNTTRVGTLMNLAAKAENADWTIGGYLNYRYAEQEANNRKIRTDNEIKGGTVINRIIIEKVSVFGSVDLEKDELEKLSLRSIFQGGLTVSWLEGERWRYGNSVGIGGQKERFNDGTRQSSCIGILTSDFYYQVNDRINLTQKTIWYPDFQNEKSYRINAESAATIYLDNSHRFFIKAGLEHDYDNQPREKVERLDTYYFSKLGYSF